MHTYWEWIIHQITGEPNNLLGFLVQFVTYRDSSYKEGHIGEIHLEWGDSRPGSKQRAPKDRSSSMVEVSLEQKWIIDIIITYIRVWLEIPKRHRIVHEHVKSWHEDRIHFLWIKSLTLFWFFCSPFGGSPRRWGGVHGQSWSWRSATSRSTC